MLAEALLQRVAPGDELEAQAIVDRRDPPAGDPGRANQSAGGIFSGSRWLPGQAALGGQCLADAVDVGAFQLGDQVAWGAELAVAAILGISHVGKRAFARLLGGADVAAKARMQHGLASAADHRPVQPGRAFVAHLPVEWQV